MNAYADEIRVLTEFRALLVEWEGLFSREQHMAILFAASSSRPPPDERLEVVRTQMNRFVSRVQHAMDRVQEESLIVHNGQRLHPLDAIFWVPECIPRVLDLVDRAIGAYEHDLVPDEEEERPFDPIDVSFISDVPLRGVLERNIKELESAMAAQAWTAAIVLAGSIAEGALSFLLNRRQAEAIAAATAIENRPPPAPRRRITSKPIDEWTLWAYIEVASELNLLKGTTNAMAHGVIREFRNMVHPRVQLRDNLIPDRHAADGSVVYLRAVLADVAAAI